MRFEFSGHTLDAGRRELCRGAVSVAVEPQVFDLLLYLLEHRDRVVGKDELLDAIWHGRIVSESTLASRINAARRAIGDNGGDQRLIRTVARRGFRFVGQAQTLGQAPAAGGPEPPDAGAAAARAAATVRPAIAVLPFVNMSGDPDQEYFSDGITEDLITALSRQRWFMVIARSSSFAYRGRMQNVELIGAELGAGYVVEGSVRRHGGHVRITAQLVDAASGSHLWAERYDRALADVFAVQDEISGAIVAAIEPQLYAAESFRATRKAPESMDAWDLLMRALAHYWRVTRQDNLVAQALLEKAIGIDPEYGRAQGVLAASHTFGAHMGWEELDGAVAIAEHAARAAAAADREDAWARHALGCAYLFTRRFDDCLAEFDLATRLNPGFLLAQAYHALALAYCGRWREAEGPAARALHASPRDPLRAIYLGISAYVQFVAGRYAEAMSLARDSLRERADFVGAHRVLTAAAAMAGDEAAATAALEELRRTQPGLSLEWIARRMPIRLEADRDRYLEGFRRAGLA
ncbi:MAG: winged helix-turn-helix domain-containing protein [Gammaproteobacteria bacterium]